MKRTARSGPAGKREPHRESRRVDGCARDLGAQVPQAPGRVKTDSVRPLGTTGEAWGC